MTENEETLNAIIKFNDLLIEDICQSNYAIAQHISEITAVIGIGYTEFEVFLSSHNHPVIHTVQTELHAIDTLINRLFKLNETIVILLSHQRETITRNIYEINKIIELKENLNCKR